MESLLNEQELNVDLPQPGEIRTGMIASISPSQILVSIGAKSEGVVSGRELDALTPEEREALKVGQEVHVFVLNPEDENGNVVLSLKRAQEQMSWENVEKLLEGDTNIDSKIIGFNKGGLIVAVEGLRGNGAGQFADGHQRGHRRPRSVGAARTCARSEYGCLRVPMIW